VPVSGLQHLEATAILLVLVNRPVELVSAYLPSTRPLIESDLSECLSGGGGGGPLTTGGRSQRETR
jgi:hypothetical protein